MEKGQKILLYPALFIVATYFLIAGLIMAESFLVPLFTAMVLAFMMLPVTNKLEKWGFHKILAATVSTLILLLVAACFAAVLFFQIRGFVSDWEEMKERLEERIENFTEYLVENTPLEQDYVNSIGLNFGIGKEKDVRQDIQRQPDRKGEDGKNDQIDQEAVKDAGTRAINVVGAIFIFLTNVLITFVYVFLFIFFRSRFKTFILRFFSRERRDEVSKTISRSSSLSRRYLAGRLFLMVILAGLYFTGLAISGLENALFISLIAAVLSIIPIVGNFIGYIIAMGVALLTDGTTGTLIGITLTFIVAQFVDTYILQPIVLGDRVGVHPFFIILSVILGNEIWGIMGMVLAIPVFGIIAEVCRHVPALNPFGYLFSKKDISEPGDGVSK
jgi:predicted PurR-regulated permease PerM